MSYQMEPPETANSASVASSSAPLRNMPLKPDASETEVEAPAASDVVALLSYSDTVSEQPFLNVTVVAEAACAHRAAASMAEEANTRTILSLLLQSDTVASGAGGGVSRRRKIQE